MPLILRSVKGSKLSIAEMDGNLTYLSNTLSGSIIEVTGSSIDASNTDVTASSFSSLNLSTFYNGQIVVGNVTFPSSSFISSTNTSGSLYFSSLNSGILFLNADGGEGDVRVGYNGWGYKMDVRGPIQVTNIQGTGSMFLKPNESDVAGRQFEIYNTAPSDIHFKGHATHSFFGDDINYLKIDNSASTATIDSTNGLFIETNTTISGSLNVSQGITGSLLGTASSVDTNFLNLNKIVFETNTDIININNTQLLTIYASAQYNIQKILAPNLITVYDDIIIQGCNYITSASFPVLSSVSRSLSFNDCQLLGYINLPNLEYVGVSAPIVGDITRNSIYFSLLGVSHLDISSLLVVSGSLNFVDADLLTSIDLPSLTNVTNILSIYKNDSITSIDLSSLVNVGKASIDAGNPLIIKDNPSLTTITLNNNLVITGSISDTIDFSNNALNQTTVDRVLEVFASGSQSNLNLYLDEGTNAEPSSNGQDSKIVLQGRGWTVYLNGI